LSRVVNTAAFISPIAADDAINDGDFCAAGIIDATTQATFSEPASLVATDTAAYDLQRPGIVNAAAQDGLSAIDREPRNRNDFIGTDLEDAAPVRVLNRQLVSARAVDSQVFVHLQLAVAEFDGAKNAPGVDGVAVVSIRYRLTQGATAVIVGIYDGDGICMGAGCDEPPQTTCEQNPATFHWRRVFSKSRYTASRKAKSPESLERMISRRFRRDAKLFCAWP
jgi:hypothetical protein